MAEYRRGHKDDNASCIFNAIFEGVDVRCFGRGKLSKPYRLFWLA